MRRKGPIIPLLPLSVFSPPNSGTSDRFPLPPSPSTVHPIDVVDAHVITPRGDLAQWKKETSLVMSGRIRGIVLSLSNSDPDDLSSVLAQFVPRSFFFAFVP
jgi:hypothetical protein